MYKFAVTAVDKVKGESGYSYQVTAKEGETPVLNFSDITSGPNTGLNDGIGDGAIVTVWGNNLGCAKNDSKIYFKDSSNNLIPVEHVYYWKIADGKLPGGPADLYSSHQMQELAFSIPNTATLGLGKIFIEKDGVKSNELDFTVRTGPIFYVAFTGNDSAGDGSFLKPWKTFGYATNGASTKNSVIPGTIIYGVDVTELQEVSIRVKDGTEASPIALIAYPGKVLSIKNNTTVNTREGGLVAYNITDKPEFWVFSKWDVRAKGSAGIVPFNGGRIIGNAITDYLNGEGCADGAAGAICSTNGTSANAKIFGNYIHDWGCYNTSNQEHTTYFSIRNQGFNSAPLEFAWNNLSNNSARFGIHFYDEHDCWGYTGVTRIHDNFVLNQVGPGFNLGAMGCNTGRALSGDFDVYNNVFVNTGLLGANNAGFSAIHLYGNNTQSHVRIYNNTIYGYGYLGAGENGYDAGFCVDSSMGNGGSYNFSGTYEFINNIVVDTNNLSFVTKTNPKLPRAATNNIWYNGGDNIPASTPDWSLNTITSNPLFVNPSKNNFYLQQNSPAINSGSLSVVQVVTKDFIGVNRPYGQYFDIGAYEYTENEIIINFDINSDFQTNILDVQTFINHFIGTMVNPNADVNKDGVVNVDDLLILNNKILELDCGC
ncbi:MAG: hypothetical protein ACD_79C00917G0001 [uncultured bacterium]|nr:MAG: hypothetical protein ACD_79C00917G0001 [uncultured bacterium]